MVDTTSFKWGNSVKWGIARLIQETDSFFPLSIPQLCNVVVIALILLVLLLIAGLFYHLPKVKEKQTNKRTNRQTNKQINKHKIRPIVSKNNCLPNILFPRI